MDLPPRATAIVPERTSSRMPKGSSTSSSASSFCAEPVASIVTASVDTSTTLARNSSTAWTTDARVDASERTLTRMWSRWEDCSGISSTILMTLTSLLSCLVTCSRASPSASTTTVMRDSPSTSEGPTVSDSMLNARRAKSPATRVRTPGTSWTSTERVWRCILGLLVPFRGHIPGYLNLVIGYSGRHHWPHHGVGRDDEVDHDGTVVDFHGFFDGRGDVFFFFNSDGSGSVGICECDEVGHPCRVCTGVQVGIGVPGVIEQGLPLAHHAQRGVINQSDLDRNLVDGTGGQFLVGHLETAVTVNGPDRTVWFSNLRSHSGWDGKAHGSQASGVHPLVGSLIAHKLGAPHLVLSYAGNVDGLGSGNLGEGFDDFLWCHQPVTRGRVAQRVGVAGLIDDAPPFAQIRFAVLGEAGANLFR